MSWPQRSLGAARLGLRTHQLNILVQQEHRILVPIPLDALSIKRKRARALHHAYDIPHMTPTPRVRDGIREACRRAAQIRNELKHEGGIPQRGGSRALVDSGTPLRRQSGREDEGRGGVFGADGDGEGHAEDRVEEGRGVDWGDGEELVERLRVPGPQGVDGGEEGCALGLGGGDGGAELAAECACLVGALDGRREEGAARVEAAPVQRYPCAGCG